MKCLLFLKPFLSSVPQKNFISIYDSAKYKLRYEPIARTVFNCLLQMLGKLPRADIYHNLPLLHHSYRGMREDEAELKFLKEVQRLKEYGTLFYRVSRVFPLSKFPVKHSDICYKIYWLYLSSNSVFSLLNFHCLGASDQMDTEFHEATPNFKISKIYRTFETCQGSRILETRNNKKCIRSKTN